LLRGQRRRDGDGPEFVRELGGIEPRAGRRPIPGSELEIPLTGPERDDSNDLGEIRLGIEAVQLAGRDKREEIRRGAGVVVGAEEEPGLAARADGRAQRAFTVVVGDGKPAVVEKTTSGSFCRTA